MECMFSNESKTAFLTKGLFLNTDLLDQCVFDIQHSLHTRPEIVVYGRICNMARDVGFFSNTVKSYTYSKQSMYAQPLTINLAQLLFEVNQLLNIEFNAILINRYNNGENYIGAHSDDEKELDNSGVATISYGEQRNLRIRSKETKEILYDEEMIHGGIYYMGGNFQSLYTHEIPKQIRRKNPRISFTFRKHKQ